MKTLVAGAFEAGSHWAHAINTVKMADGFARLGADVTLVCRRPRAGVVPASELAREYGLGAPLRWVQVRGHRLGRPSGPHREFAARALPTVLRVRPDLVYARNYALPAWTARLGITTAVETHAHPGNAEPAFRRLVRASHRPALRCWVTIADVLKVAHAQAGVPAEKILVLPDAVDVELFAPPADRGASPFPEAGPVALYAGHLYDHKGIPTVLGAATLLPGVRFHLLGGWPEDVDRWRLAAEREELSNVVLHGLRPHAEVPRYLWHADVLLLPPSGRHESAAWTSPVKLGEYFASGTPVVASAIPALRRQVKDDVVEWVEPDRPEALAAGIRRVLEAPGHAARLSENGRRAAGLLGYAQRARRIIEACRIADGSLREAPAP